MAEFLPPIPVDQMVADALNAFLSAAALQLGEPDSDGNRLQPNPSEAWLALMGASALTQGLGPVMAEAVRTHFGRILDALLARFAEAFPDEVVPMPGLLQAQE